MNSNPSLAIEGAAAALDFFESIRTLAGTNLNKRDMRTLPIALTSYTRWQFLASRKRLATRATDEAALLFH